MKDKLFLDDVVSPICRHPETKDEDWDVVRSFEEFRDFILTNGVPKLISFDHDLNIFSKDGNDCAKWLVEYCIDNNLGFCFEYIIHSMNPAGVERIHNTLMYFKNYLEKDN